MVTSSRQVTEVKQYWSRLVLGWVTGALVTLLAMCRGVWQDSHIMSAMSMQQWRVPGGMRKLHCNDCRKCWSPQERWDCKWGSSNTESKLWSLLNSRGYQTAYIHILHIYLHNFCNLGCSLAHLPKDLDSLESFIQLNISSHQYSKLCIIYNISVYLIMFHIWCACLQIPVSYPNFQVVGHRTGGCFLLHDNWKCFCLKQLYVILYESISSDNSVYFCVCHIPWSYSKSRWYVFH